MIKYIVSFSIMIILVIIFLFSRLSDFELAGYGQLRTLSFTHHQDLLQGT